MLLYVVIAALVLVAAAIAYPLLRAPSRLDEVDRFHVASALTSTWASEPVRPLQPADDESD